MKYWLGKPKTKEIKEKIEAVTTFQLLEIANEILENKQLSVLKYSLIPLFK